jgi:hypothetical protein
MTQMIYLSGPISLGGSLTEEEQAAFVASFAHEAERLAAVGYLVKNPCGFPRCESWEDYMRYGIEAVTEADIVGVLPRWDESRGATLEVFVATQLKIPVRRVEDIQ